MRTWLATSHQRQFRAARPGGKRALSLAAARGQSLAFQAACATPAGSSPGLVRCRVDAPVGVGATVRVVGSVPVPHHNTATPAAELDGLGFIPGYVPDPLQPGDTALAAGGEVVAFWVTLNVSRQARAGEKKVRVTLEHEADGASQLEVSVEVAAATLGKRKGLTVCHWFYADSLCDWYGVEPFEKAFWPICENYMRDYAAHGLDLIYLPVFTPPLDGIKRPTQLLRVTRTGKDSYKFDWRDVKKWVDLARKCGIRKFEWTHWFTQWGVKYAIRIYEKKDGRDVLLWPPSTGATSKTYRSFLAQFFPALERFMRREKLMRNSYFHISDEPHGAEHLANYRKAREMVRELAPWMKVMDALTEIEYGRQGLTDTPIPSIKTARQFYEEGIPSWAYYCCGPRGRYTNRLLDTPLVKVRALGWLLYRFQRHGFLHWGYNYWYKSQTREMIDPYLVQDGLKWPGWAYGDTCVVYPGEDGRPVDALRWEVFHETLQDYALLEQAGVDPEGRLLAPLRSFEDFPRDEKWYDKARRQILGLK